MPSTTAERQADLSDPYLDSLPSSINPMALTTASWITLTEVGFRMSLGYSEREVAKELGVPKKNVEQRLDVLRSELMDQ